MPRSLDLSSEQEAKVIELVDERGILEAVLYLRLQFSRAPLRQLQDTAEFYKPQALSRGLGRLYKQLGAPDAPEESR